MYNNLAVWHKVVAKMADRSLWICAVRSIIMLLVQLLAMVAATHFRGGLIYWKTVGPVNATNGLVPVEITQRYGWRRSWNPLTLCDDHVISAGNLSGETGDFVCQSGCPVRGQTLGSVQIYCTDYSVSNDWMVGERSYVVWLPSSAGVVTASFAGREWVKLAHPVSTGSSAAWELRVTFNLNATSRSTGNASPVTKMSPVVQMFHGCDYTIRVPAVDPDGDTVRCRWANFSFGECSDVCMSFPGANLDPQRCTISYRAAGAVGVYAVAIQIEDFDRADDTKAISSVPLQFLVNVSRSSLSCNARPVFVPPTVADGTCIAIPPNTTYTGILVARGSGPDTRIIDITTQSPAGMHKSALMKGLGENEWHVNVTWRPTSSQAGTNIFCFVAVENTTASSDQSCIYFAVGTRPPRPKLGSMSPTGLIARDHSKWRIEFDRVTARPSKSSYIRFHDARGDEIFAIDSATDPGVVFTSSTSSSAMTFETRHLFDENSFYYVTLDDGVGVGKESCGLASTGVERSDFWVVHTGSTMPPLPLLTIHQSSTSRRVSCAFDGDLGSACVVDSPSVSLTLECVGSVSLTHLRPGFHTLDVRDSFLLDSTQVVPITRTTEVTRGWTSWSEWSCCSRSCDAGLQQRVRHCQSSRDACHGDSTNVRLCNVHPCASAGIARAIPVNTLRYRLSPHLREF